jgi:hypothetical protein
MIIDKSLQSLKRNTELDLTCETERAEGEAQEVAEVN